MIYESERTLWKEKIEWEVIKEYEEAKGLWSEASEFLYQGCVSRWSVMWRLRRNIQGKTDICGMPYEVGTNIKPYKYKLEKIAREDLMERKNNK